MSKKRNGVWLSLAVLLVAAAIVIAWVVLMDNQSRIESTWMEYRRPEEAGWSSQKLREARKYYEKIHSSAAMVIYDGRVLLAWGDITKNMNAHSVRKSFLSALYGIYVNEGAIDLDRTLGELGIQERPLLSETERNARVVDLLTSRSGVYLRAGQETRKMRRIRPSRGDYMPGSHFYYNNWDFNVLGTIFNQQTESDLFDEFMDRIAGPIGMEDFSLENTRYLFETYSLHPSYLFRMSARDMARFGELYLNRGFWGPRSIVPENWIDESIKTYTPSPEGSIYGYGYMWWTADSGYFGERHLYSAIGRYGQSIDILPEDKLVFVHRVDSDRLVSKYFHHVGSDQRLLLLRKIMEAKIDMPKRDPAVRPGITVLH